ncbi:MAG: glycoside hydrolase family 15 protein [Chloroflexi bacterium]|nr:glycoside hydrolase family 15 protein [Chloroflexota bacterium]
MSRPFDYGYPPIQDHGVIGDLHTAALVAIDGTIDWLCMPRFDSPSIFASILDRKKGGYFRLRAASDRASCRQLYVPETNVLVTRFLTADGVGEIQDCMPIESDRHGLTAQVHQLVRTVTSVRGTVVFDLECCPAFDYARAGCSVTEIPDGLLFTSDGSDGTRLALIGTVSPRLVNGVARARFVLDEGQWAVFGLRYLADGDAPPVLGPPQATRDATEQTIDYWQRWLRRSTYRGRWRGIVERSALTLKLLTYVPTGAVIASPTMGLPEEIGGERNWDYRYTWLRDASFTLFALMRIGFMDEAAGFMHWLSERCAEAGDEGLLQIMYGIDGRHRLDETVLAHLEGYSGSRPVRLGNGAYTQLQLDIYGEVLDAVYLYDKYGMPISYDLWQHLVRVLDRLCTIWQLPDEGIWEVRGGRQHFTYSKMMCWVAFDRALRMANKRGLPAPRARWEETMSAIYQQVMSHGYDPIRQTFVQYYGSDYLDAANLLMPMVKFVSPTDPRMLGTLTQIRHGLVSDSLVYRYAHANAAADGLTGREGTFSMCTFWLVEALSRAGELREARLVFEKMMTYANPLGLYSEQLGPSAEALGNFPQAFTHLALISSAYNLDRILDARL